MTYRYRQLIEEGGGLTFLRERYRLTPSELLVLTNLIKHDHPQNGCFPKQATIAHETGLQKTQVWRALGGLEKKGLFTREKKPYRDARGRVRAGKIHHYEFAEIVNRVLEFAGQAFDEYWDAERHGRLPDKALMDFAEGNAGQSDFPIVHNNGTNGQSEGDAGAPDSSQYVNPIVHNSGTEASRIVDRTVHNGGIEKLEVEGVTENGRRDSRTAAADAAIDGSDTIPEVTDSGLQPRSGRDAPEPEAVVEKFCACGKKIPADKAAVRDECYDCYIKPILEKREQEKRKEEERKREGFLLMRERERSQRG